MPKSFIVTYREDIEICDVLAQLPREQIAWVEINHNSPSPEVIQERRRNRKVKRSYTEPLRNLLPTEVCYFEKIRAFIKTKPNEILKTQQIYFGAFDVLDGKVMTYGSFALSKLVEIGELSRVSRGVYLVLMVD